MTAPRDYFPKPRVTRPADDAPTFAQGVLMVLLDVQLLARPQDDAEGET